MNTLKARQKILEALDAANDIKATVTEQHMIVAMADLLESMYKMYRELSDLDGHTLAVPDGPERSRSTDTPDSQNAAAPQSPVDPHDEPRGWH